MRAVHSYINISNRGLCAYNHSFDILLWKLSALRNHKLGFTTVLYVLEKDRSLIESLSFSRFYDEIHYISSSKLKNVEVSYFWSVMKFIAIEEELKQDEDFFLVDTDLVFMDDSIVEKLKLPTLFWQNNEPMINYPSLTKISYPPGFKYPRYFSVTTRPFNMAIIKCDNRDVYREFLNLVWRFMKYNNVSQNKDCVKSGYAVTSEQRFFPNVLINKFHIQPNFYCQAPIVNFGKEHFHIWGAKGSIDQVKFIKYSWVKGLLLLFEKEGMSRDDSSLVTSELIKDVLDKWDVYKVPDSLNIYFK